MLNCINRLNNAEFGHLVICLTHATEFASALPADVPVYCLDKKPGTDLSVHYRLWHLLRQLQPAVLHSYNLATLEYHPIAWLAGVRGHLHAEHGRDISDPNGAVKKYQWLRRFISPFLQTYVAVSADLHRWLAEVVRINPSKNQLIYNGVDTDTFVPSAQKNTCLTFIHVARLAAVKNQQLLLRAIAQLQQQFGQSFKLLLVGDGPLRQDLVQLADELGLPASLLEFTGSRQDVTLLLQQSHVFVLCSQAEGIPMTILEAMSSGLPVVATAVGGVPELINSEVGQLVPAADVDAMAAALASYLNDHTKAALQGHAARQRVVAQFSGQQMVNQYLQLYRRLAG